MKPAIDIPKVSQNVSITPYSTFLEGQVQAHSHALELAQQGATGSTEQAPTGQAEPAATETAGDEGADSAAGGNDNAHIHIYLYVNMYMYT